MNRRIVLSCNPGKDEDAQCVPLSGGDKRTVDEDAFIA